MHLKTKLASAAAAAVSAGVAAAIVIPTAVTNANPTPAGPVTLPIAALKSPAPLVADGKVKAELLTATKQIGIDSEALSLAAPGVWAAQRPNGEVCLLATNEEGLGAGCWTVEASRAGGVSLESVKDGVVTRTGLVPDGYTTAVARTASGAAVAQSSIAGNVYRIAGKDIATIELTGAAKEPTLKAKVDPVKPSR